MVGRSNPPHEIKRGLFFLSAENMKRNDIMSTSNATTKPLLIAIRWTARISSIPIIAVFLLMFFGEGFDPTKVKPNEWIMLLFGPFGFMFGMILGWWKEGLGGAITIMSFFGAMLVGDYSGSGATNMAICAAPGFLFALAWFLSKLTIMSKDNPASEENLSQPPAREKP